MDEDEDGTAASSVSEEEDVAGPGETEKQIKEVVEHMDGVVGRISKLLRQQHRGRRVSSIDSFRLLWLRYLEVELSGISESLKQLPLLDLGPDYIDSEMSRWFMGLTHLAKYLHKLVDNHEQAGATVGCFCTCTRTSLPSLDLFEMMIDVLYLSEPVESPCRYKHLLLAEDEEITSSSLQPQPYDYEETDWSSVMPHPYVGIESALGNKALRWFMDDHGRYKGLKIISMVGPAGVGKTAIAMEVYRRLQARSGGTATATLTAIAKVSPRPHMKKLLLHILSQIDEPAALALASIDELEQLVHEISQCLQDRRYKHLLLAEDEEITTSSSLQPQPYVETDATRVMPHPYVGIETALGKKELRWFMNENDHQQKGLKIISMAGPAGVGKTAIAMEVYRRLQARSGGNSATVTAIAKVSSRPDMKKLLLRILSQIDQPAALALPSIDELKLELLVHKISQCLQNRRYLILIDDIWKISDWESMKNAFPQNSQGSRIVMTTRIGSVASRCCLYSSGLVHEVKSLCEVDSKMLLSRKAFGCEVNYAPENLSLVCAEILRRCEGIPLFIHGMADWLQEQHQRVQHMSNYIIEEAPQLLKLFERALSPSYDDLTYKMKLLVLYMSSMFPEGYIFETDTLHLKWRLDVGGSYAELFSELIDRNVITPVANWKKGTPQLEEEEEEASHYKVNHFMLQFLASKSKGFICSSGTLTSVPSNEMLRRISLHRPDSDLKVFLKTMDFSQTRSLAISSPVEEVPLNKFIHLIVLDLEGWQHLKDADLSLICNSGMLLLKYFSVRNTSVSRLPPEIKKLTVLDTLVASHTQISEVPSEVCELLFLDSLDLRSTQIRQLPAHIWKVPSLRTLLVGGGGVNCDPTITEVPKEVLYSFVNTLGSVDLSECSADIVRSLGCLKRLHVVRIRWSFHECSDAGVQQALCSAIKRWTSLKSLTIHCGLGCQMDFLAAFLLDTIFLEKFKVIGGRFVSLPPCFRGYRNLASIEITVCRLKQGDLRILASLPSLKCLVLGVHFVPEEEIVIGGREEFLKLERLSVCCRVPWLTFSEGAMTSLTYLELKIGGGKLLWIEERIPSGLGNLRSLSKLSLHYNQVYSNDSNVKTIVDAVRKGVAQHHNLINLVINGVQYEDGYVQEEAECGVAVISCIPYQNDSLQKAREDAARATGNQSEIEVIDVPYPKLYNQSTASQLS